MFNTVGGIGRRSLMRCANASKHSVRPYRTVARENKWQVKYIKPKIPCIMHQCISRICNRSCSVGRRGGWSVGRPISGPVRFVEINESIYFFIYLRCRKAVPEPTLTPACTCVSFTWGSDDTRMYCGTTTSQ